MAWNTQFSVAGRKNSILILGPMIWSGFLKKCVKIDSEAASGSGVDWGLAVGIRVGNRVLVPYILYRLLHCVHFTYVFLILVFSFTPSFNLVIKMFFSCSWFSLWYLGLYIEILEGFMKCWSFHKGVLLLAVISILLVSAVAGLGWKLMKWQKPDEIQRSVHFRVSESVIKSKGWLMNC